METRLESLETKVGAVETRPKSVETKVDAMKIRLESIETKLETLEIKQDVTTRKFEDINFRLTSLEYNNKKKFLKVNDEAETLIAVMEAKTLRSFLLLFIA